MTFRLRTYAGPVQLAFGWCPLLLGVLATAAHARTWHVLEDGSGDAPTVQAGLDSAAVSDTILVGPGTYFENIDFLGKDVVLKAESGPEATILDGSLGNDSVVKFQNAETRAAILEGFTITGGLGTFDFGSPRGGGIACINASPVIRDNRIVNNQSTITSSHGGGGGMAVGSGLVETPSPSPLIEGNLFEGNASDPGNGGGLSIQANADDVIVRGNVFRGNSCQGDGAGVWVLVCCGGSATITENEFWENTAGDHGGGLDVGNTGLADPLMIEWNLFVGNRADGEGTGDTGSGGAIYCGTITGSISHNTMVRNQAFGEASYNGGGVDFKNAPDNLEVRGNLMAYNEGGGISCRLSVPTGLGPNLFWQNSPADIEPACPSEWLGLQIVADPLFCGTGVDDYTVAFNSPALTGEEVMGAFSEPGCGPVHVQNTTWGRLKTLFLSD